MTDSQLLDRYIHDRDEACFRDLVIRHGPTVLQACRRVLIDPQEVDDAFQATFVVLVRKAPAIESPEALGAWLRGVAHRVAWRARRGIARRRAHERRRAEMSPSRVEPEPARDDLAGPVREELASLARPYRVPLELCYLHGRSHEEAARELGWPLGTLKTRLVRGRRLLRERLDRRGLAPGLALLLLLLGAGRSSVSLIDATVDAMRRQAASPSPTPASRAAIGRRRVWSWAGAGLALAMLAASLGLALQSRARAEEQARAAERPPNLNDVLNVECR